MAVGEAAPQPKRAELTLIAHRDPPRVVRSLEACWRAGAVPSVLPPGARIRELATEFRASAIWTSEGFHRLEGGEPLPNARYVQFSSGTTSRPRAVILTASAIDRFLESYARRFACSSADTIVNWVPLHHDLGLFQGVLLPRFLGCESVILGTQAVLRRPASLLRTLHERCATVTSIFNSGLALISRVTDREIDGVDLSSLRVLSCGGEMIRESNVRSFVDRFARFGLRPEALLAGYGLAESVMGCAAGPSGPLRVDWVEARSLNRAALPTLPGAPGAVPVVSCGPPLDGNEIATADDDGRILGEREVGEIIVRGPTLMSGYLHDAEATAAALRDGWLHTGDTGYMVDGEVYPCDRKKDLIIAGGRNVAPALLESIALDALGEHTRRVVAFGLPDAELGTETPIVVCGVRPDLDREVWNQAVQLIRERCLRDTGVMPSDIRAVAPGWIEVTTSGKVARSRAKAKYMSEFPPTDQGPASDLLRIARSTLGLPALDPGADLVKAGVDSLSLLRLVVAVERARGVKVDADAWMAEPTVASLERHLGTQAPAAPPAPPPTPRRARSSTWDRVVNLARNGPVFRDRPLIPYWLGRPILARWAASSWVRRRFLAPDVALIREALPDLDAAALDRAVHARAWSTWRWRALSDPHTLDRWLCVRGGEHVDRALAAGKGVVFAVAHSPVLWLAALLPWWRTRESIAIGNVTLSESGVAYRATGPGGRVAQLAEARRILASGGAVWIAPDLSVGNGGIATRFHGRWKVFRPGFAELALDEEAPVIPVFSGVDLDGTVWFEFLAPLRAPAAQGPRSAQVNDLLRQYAAILEDRWARDPGALYEDTLREFLRRPACEPATAAPARSG